jgi:hypothetical protein
VIVTQLLLMVSLVLVIFAASASAEPLVYVVTASQQFGTVDLATGHFQGYRQWDARCPVQFSVVEGSDSAHAYNYSVDPETGAATPIGATGMPPDPTIPFTFNDDGTFNLCDEGLYGVGGKLYATFDSFALDPTQTPPTIAHVHVYPALYQIDPATGVATFVAKTDLLLSALVEVDGKFYAFRGVLDGFNFTFGFPVAHADLVTLNLETGKTNKLTDIDHSVGPIFGAAPVRSSR